MNIKISALMAVLAIAGITVPARAAQYKLQVTLPAETHWGVATLEPGDYTITPAGPNSEFTLLITGHGKTAIVNAATVEMQQPAGTGGLELAEINGSFAATKLTTPLSGLVFTFTPSKAHRERGFLAMKKTTLPVRAAR